MAAQVVQRLIQGQEMKRNGPKGLLWTSSGSDPSQLRVFLLHSVVFFDVNFADEAKSAKKSAKPSARVKTEVEMCKLLLQTRETEKASIHNSAGQIVRANKRGTEFMARTKQQQGLFCLAV